ncbi:MAG: VOC family protein [Pelobium sp.]
MEISSYLTFNGNCREAMSFYQQCLGGELTLQTIAESPMAKKMPYSMRNAILHATLQNGTLKILASDMVSEKGLTVGNSVSLMLNCDSELEIKEKYSNLSEGGKKEHPLENTFWGAIFGDVTDKFGHHWLLHFQKN